MYYNERILANESLFLAISLHTHARRHLIALYKMACYYRHSPVYFTPASTCCTESENEGLLEKSMGGY